MKKIILLLSVTIAIISCNKPITTYPTANPWGGIDPFSAIVNGVSVAPTFANINITDTTPVIVNSIITENFGGDSSRIRVFGILMPNGGGAVNKIMTADSMNKAYGVTYRETLKKGTKILSEKYFTTFNALPGCTIKLLQYDTFAKGIFNGFLRNANNSNEYMVITNGYFKVPK